MPRIALSADDKTAARGVLLKTWQEADLTQRAIDEAARPFAVNPREAYMTLLHMDTLDCLKDLDFLVFKGGTCVQTYLAPGFQRLSVDVDFNSRHPHPNTVESDIQDLNGKLRADGRAVTVQGVEFGTLLPEGFDRFSGTVEFARYLPTPFDEQATLPTRDTVQARKVRIQINTKHHELPAIKPTKREVRFFTSHALRPKRKVQVECASVADLVADKIFTITKDAGGFGRERLKDFYDLSALRRLDIDRALVTEKLDRVAKAAKTTRPAILTGAIERCETVKAKWNEARGSGIPMACNDGKRIFERWEEEMGELHGLLRELRD